jgi:lysophospholipase L1-like esterase
MAKIRGSWWRVRRLALLPLVATALLTGCSYVVLGDSIGVIGDRTYATDYGATLHVAPEVLAVNGMTLPAFEQSLQQDQALHDTIAHTDLITVSIGSNDLINDLLQYYLGACTQACVDDTLAQFEATYAQMLKELRAMTRARITVLDIYNPVPRLVNDYVLGKVAAINTFIHQSACAQGIFRASINAAFNGPDGTWNPADRGYLLADGTHPSEAGAQVIAQAVLAAHC